MAECMGHLFAHPSCVAESPKDAMCFCPLGWDKSSSCEATTARPKPLPALSPRYEIPDTQTADEKQLEILQDKANFRNFKPKPFNMLEFYDRAGHDIREMLLSCFFRGEQCSPEDFKVVSAPTAPSPGCEFHARRALVCLPPFLPPFESQRRGSSTAEGVPGAAAGA